MLFCKRMGWCLAVLLAGCSSAPINDTPSPQAPVLILARLYGEFRVMQNKPPANEEELKQYLATKGEAFLAGMGVKSADELFRSPRDHQSLVIIYNSNAGAEENYPPIMAERVGVDGLHWAANEFGSISELNETDFKKRFGSLVK